VGSSPVSFLEIDIEGLALALLYFFNPNGSESTEASFCFVFSAGSPFYNVALVAAVAAVEVVKWAKSTSSSTQEAELELELILYR